MGLALPGAEEGTTHGARSLKVGGRMFACKAIHRSAEPDTLAVRIDFAQRDELMAADPESYYLTEHYVNYPVVLVRLSRVHPDALRDLLTIGWRYVSASAKRRRGGRLVVSARSQPDWLARRLAATMKRPQKQRLWRTGTRRHADTVKIRPCACRIDWPPWHG